MKLSGYLKMDSKWQKIMKSSCQCITCCSYKRNFHLKILKKCENNSKCAPLLMIHPLNFQFVDDKSHDFSQNSSNYGKIPIF